MNLLDAFALRAGWVARSGKARAFRADRSHAGRPETSIHDYLIPRSCLSGL